MNARRRPMKKPSPPQGYGVDALKEATIIMPMPGPKVRVPARPVHEAMASVKACAGLVRLARDEVRAREGSSSKLQRAHEDLDHALVQLRRVGAELEVLFTPLPGSGL